MTTGAHSIRFSASRALLVAAGTTVVFLVMNADFDVGPVHLGVSMDPTDAIRVIFAFVGLFSFVAILFYIDAKPNRGSLPDPNAAFGGSEALMTREPLTNAAAMAPVHALVFAAAALVWSLLAPSPGASGTVWGDFTTSPLPLLVIFCAVTSAMNVGLAVSALIVALGYRVFFGKLLVFIMAVLGMGAAAGFWFLASTDALLALSVTLPLMVVSIAALLGARHVARISVAKVRDISAEARDREPPLDILRRGESLLISLSNRIPQDPRHLVVTDQRFLSVLVQVQGITQIVDRARPNQLTGGSTDSTLGFAVTIAHFRDHPDMRLVGSDSAEAEAFARALTHLATEGTLPD